MALAVTLCIKPDADMKAKQTNGRFDADHRPNQ